MRSTIQYEHEGSTVTGRCSTVTDLNIGAAQYLYSHNRSQDAAPSSTSCESLVPEAHGSAQSTQSAVIVTGPTAVVEEENTLSVHTRFREQIHNTRNGNARTRVLVAWVGHLAAANASGNGAKDGRDCHVSAHCSSIQHSVLLSGGYVLARKS